MKNDSSNLNTNLNNQFAPSHQGVKVSDENNFKNNTQNA